MSDPIPLEVLVSMAIESLVERLTESLVEAVAERDSVADRLPDHRLAMTKRQAAEALGVSVDSLERHVMPEIKVARCGSTPLIPCSELVAWLERNAARLGERA